MSGRTVSFDCPVCGLRHCGETAVDGIVDCQCGQIAVPWPRPILLKASDLMGNSTMTIDLKIVHDWRFRLGLWAMKLGSRVMRSNLKMERPMIEPGNIELGNKVRCRVSGFEGIAVARCEYVNGCVQIGIKPRVGADGKMPDTLYIDIESLEVVGTGVTIPSRPGGGESRAVVSAR